MTQFAIAGGMHEYTIYSIVKAIFTSQIGQIKAALDVLCIPVKAGNGIIIPNS